MDGGAALRARAISAFRSAEKYWSSDAIRAYCVLASCAHVCRETPETVLRTRIRRATAGNPFRIIEYSGKALEANAKRQLTETAFVVVAAGAEGTKTALFLCYAHSKGKDDQRDPDLKSQQHRKILMEICALAGKLPLPST
jgi:hypothetical protein